MSVSKLNDYLKVTDAAKYLGISANTLRNWEASGKITVHRNPMNGYRLFKQEELDAFLARLEDAGQQPLKGSSKTGTPS